MHHWSQQQQQQTHNSINNQGGSRDGNIDRLTPGLSQSSSSLATNKDTTEEKYHQQFQLTDVSIHLNDCMQCFVRLPRCEIEQDKNCYNKNTQTAVEQHIQGFHEDNKEKNEINKGTTTSISSLHHQNKTVSVEQILDWQSLYPEDYYSTEHYFYSPQK